MNSSKFLLGESKWILALGCKSDPALRLGVIGV